MNKMRETVRRYRLRNKEKLQQQAKLWRENNKDKVKEQYERRRSKDNFKEQSKKWRHSKNNRCVDCGKPICNRSMRCGECGHKNRSLNSRETIICPNCNQSFIGYKSAKRLYCSRDCYFESRIPYNKEKTLEEIHGIEKADRIRKQISRVRIERGIAKGEKNPIYGRKRSEKVKKAVSEANMGNTAWNKRKSHLKREKNPNWKGGISFEPYTLDFNEKLKKLIKERDNCCMLCKTNLLILKELKRDIHIHHIDYDKTNAFPQNLITLCNNCHTLTNNDRDKWKQFFQKLLKERYGYQYTQNQKIILDFTKRGGDNNES